MSYPYSDGRDRRSATFLAGAAVGVLVGALLLGLIWGAQSWLGSDGSEQPEATAVAPGGTLIDPVDPADPTPVGATTTRLDRCREVYDAQTDALAAAANSLSQWEVHIGAMNKLVTGAISLQQAQEFWNETRLGAALKLKRFAAADRHFGRRTARCPAPTESEATPELQACAEAVAARNRTLGLATVALATWRMHVHHMEMLRDGEMSPEEATRLWLQSWHQGNRQVLAYRAAAKAADGTTC